MEFSSETSRCILLENAGCRVAATNDQILLIKEFLHHLGCTKPCTSWDKLPIKWCSMSYINSTTLERLANFHLHFLISIYLVFLWLRPSNLESGNIGSPPFISHGVRPCGRGPTTRYLGDNNNHHGHQPRYNLTFWISNICCLGRYFSFSIRVIQDDPPTRVNKLTALLGNNISPPSRHLLSRWCSGFPIAGFLNHQQ